MYSNIVQKQKIIKYNCTDDTDMVLITIGVKCRYIIKVWTMLLNFVFEEFQ